MGDGIRVHEGNELVSAKIATSAKKDGRCQLYLSLFTIGRITGLVIDCGQLESVALLVSGFLLIYMARFMISK